MKLMYDKKIISHLFLLVVLLVALYLCYLLFRPFLMVIIMSGILVSIFHPWYIRLAEKIKGKYNLAALLMCLLVLFIIVIPVALFLFYLAQKSVEAYFTITKNIAIGSFDWSFSNNFWRRFDFVDPRIFDLKRYIMIFAEKIKDFLVSGGATIIKSTTQFLTSLILMVFTMFFLFRDGKKLLKKVMYLTPLPNKYDEAIFKKFRDVSYSSIVSVFATGIAQGIVGAIGFLAIGMPAFLAGVAMAFLSLVPYVGTFLIWFPVGVYLLITGSIWQGVFILLWGALVVGLVDNLVRPYMIKGRAEVHPLILFFSILGGIMIFGFWGLFIGPIAVALTFTLLHIYEKEYEEVLDK